MALEIAHETFVDSLSGVTKEKGAEIKGYVFCGAQS